MDLVEIDREPEQRPRPALPSGTDDFPEGQQLLGGARCQPALLHLLAAKAGRKENLVFIVWLFLISFCFRDPLLRENNALNKAPASLSRHPPSCGGGGAGENAMAGTPRADGV